MDNEDSDLNSEEEVAGAANQSLVRATDVSTDGTLSLTDQGWSEGPPPEGLHSLEAQRRVTIVPTDRRLLLPDKAQFEDTSSEVTCSLSAQGTAIDVLLEAMHYPTARVKAKNVSREGSTLLPTQGRVNNAP